MRLLPSRNTIFASILPIFVFLALLVVMPLRVAAQHWSLEDTLVITDVNIVDVRTGEVRADQVVVIERNRITAAGGRKDVRYPRNAPSVNAKGGYLIPGIVGHACPPGVWRLVPERGADFVAAVYCQWSDGRAGYGKRVERGAGVEELD